MYDLSRFVSDSNKPTIICLLGIHTSGKTTIGKRLHSLGIPYYKEIGDELIKTVDFSSPEKVAWFDGEIMKRELQRDNTLFSVDSGMAVVETWHIGNIAYAMIRTPAVAREYAARLKDQFTKCNAVHLFLDINEETFRQRANLLVPLGIKEDVFVFYKNIERNLLALLDEHNVEYHKIDANQEVEKVVDDIKEVLTAHRVPIALERQAIKS